MPDTGPVAQVEAQNAVRAVTAALSEVTQDAINTRRVAAFLLTMSAERVLRDVLAGLEARFELAAMTAIDGE